MIALKNWYRDRLAVRIAALETARRRLAAKAGESIESVLRIAHSLRGSGATYGFPQITEVARGLEEAGDEEFPARVETLLATLREAAAGGRTDRTTLLVVEDDPDQACFMEGILSGPDRDVVTASTAAQAEAILAERSVSLILLDLLLPDTDGRNLLMRLRERPATAGIPVLVVTVKGVEEARDECLALGADGFLEKPVNPAALAVAVAGRLAAGSDLSAACRRDPLTGLPNRAAFHEAYGRMQPVYVDPATPLSLGILDVDGLRGINEAHGRAVGDQVLRRAAAVISASLRATDCLARWGGGTFAVLFPATGRRGAARALDKARRLLRRERFAVGGGEPVRAAAAAGVVGVPRTVPVEEAVSRADRYLFRAKSAGRDRVAWEEGPEPAAEARVMLVEDDELMATLVRHHLEGEGFEVLHYTNGADALQALLRESVSLVVSDVQMPRMDGFELLERLRAVPSLAKVPVVLVTSMGSEEDVVRGFELGADDYILKPFSAVDFMTRLRRLLRRKAAK